MPNGRRYSQAEKKKIVQFVSSVNARNGRGGVAEAAREFGVSPSSIGSWIKSVNGSASRKAGVGSKGSPIGSRETGRVLVRLIKMREDIDALERELALKLDRFEKLKKKV